MKDVFVWQLCESDAVAAHTLDEAREWYKEITGIPDDELYSYDDVETVPHEHKIYVSEDKDEMMTVGEALNAHWKGNPFIVFTTDL